MCRHRRGRRLLVPIVLALALGGAACGSSPNAGAQVASATGAGSGAKAEDASDTKVDPEKAGLDFARCMREHGVDMPDPQSGEGGFIMVGPSESAGSDGADGPPVAGQAPPDGFVEADKACRHFLDDVIQDGGGPMDPEAQDKALKFARCMRDHGVDLPDPQFSSDGHGFSISIGGPDGGSGGIDPGSQAFQDAQKACGSLFGPGGATPGRGVATSGKATS